MTPKRRRLYFVLFGMLALGVATALLLSALEENLVYFYSPRDLESQALPADRRIRIGGLVEAGSVRRGASDTVAFRITDLSHAVAVRYRGALPDLFREGQGIVAEGRLAPDGAFVAEQILAKHDETYMPREVADALRKSGRWQGDKAAP